MLKKLIPPIAFVICSVFTAVATADVAPPGPSCRCEVPGTSSAHASPLEKGTAAAVVAMGIVVVARRNRRR